MVRPVRMASRAGPSRKSGAAGRRRSRVVAAMSSDGSSIMSAAAGLTNVSVPVGGDRADALADVEGDRGEPLPLDVDLLVQLGVAERTPPLGAF